MSRDIRCQGAIVPNNHILLIRHLEHATARVYWVIPGGGRGANETEGACVQREMREENTACSGHCGVAAFLNCFQGSSHSLEFQICIEK